MVVLMRWNWTAATWEGGGDRVVGRFTTAPSPASHPSRTHPVRVHGEHSGGDEVQGERDGPRRDLGGCKKGEGGSYSASRLALGSPAIGRHRRTIGRAQG